MKDDKKRIDLDDRVWGISGTIDPEDYKEPATGFDTDRDLVYVKYIPARKTKIAFVERLKRVIPGFSKDPVRRTPKPLPVNELAMVNTPHGTGIGEDDQDLAGQPDKKLVIPEDKDGEAPYEQQHREVESSKIRQVQQQKKNAEKNALKRSAEGVDLESNDESKDKRSRRPGLGSPLSERGEPF